MTTYNIKPKDGKVRIKFELHKHKKRQKKPLPETSEDGRDRKTEVSDRQTQIPDKG